MENQPAPQTHPPSTPRLFDRFAVALASLIGTPVAGGVLLAINALRLGQRAGAAIGFVMGLILTYSLLGLIPYASRWITPWILLPLGAVVMAWVAGMLQGEILSSRRKSGTRPAGLPGALAVGLATALLLGGSLWLARPYLLKKPQFTKLVVTENQSVNYAPPVTEEEARRIAGALQAIGYFEKSGSFKEVVLFSNNDGRRIIVFRIDPAHANDPQVLKISALIAQQFLNSGVPAPFIIRLAAPDWKVLKEIKVDLKPATHPSTTQSG